MIPAFIIVYFFAVFTIGCASKVEPKIVQREPAHISANEVAPTTQQSALSFASVLQLAAVSSSRADEAEWNTRMQEARVEEARAGYFPSLDASLIRGGDQAARSSETVGSISITQPVFDFGRTDRSVGVERANVALKQAQQEVIRDNAIYVSGSLAIEFLRRQAKEAICLKKLRQSERLRDLVRKRTQDGASASVEFVQAEAHIQAAQVELLTVKREQNLLAARLASKLGGNSSPPVINAPEKIALLAACTQSGAGMLPNAAILESEAALDLAQAGVQLARVEGLPKLTLEGKIRAMLGGEHGTDSRAGVGLKLSGDLFPTVRSAARRSHAAFGVEAAQAARQAALEEQSEAWSQSQISAHSLGEMNGILSKRVALAEKKFNLFEMQYLDAGSRSLLELLTADDEATKAQLARVDAMSDQFVAGLDCFYRSGRLGVAFGIPRVRG